MQYVFTIILSIWLARKARRWARPARGVELSGDSFRSLWLGTQLVTLPMLAFLGIIQYLHGQGEFSWISLGICILITAVFLLGIELEITGNVLIDAIIIGGLVGAFSLVTINGIPMAFSNLEMKKISLWILACLTAAMLVRAVYWTRNGR